MLTFCTLTILSITLIFNAIILLVNKSTDILSIVIIVIKGGYRNVILNNVQLTKSNLHEKEKKII